jgi:hypothetical protein
MRGDRIGCRDALGVLLDPEEASPEQVRGARAHASTCPRCSGVFDDRDAARRVRAALGPAGSNEAIALRVALVVVATVQLVLASPWLFGASLVPDAHVAAAHLTRDGAFGLVICAVGFMVAWRPRYALAGVLVGSIVVVLQAATGVVDDRSQYVNAPFELTHVLVFAIVVLVALTAGASRYRPEQQPRHRPTLRSS